MRFHEIVSELCLLFGESFYLEIQNSSFFSMIRTFRTEASGNPYEPIAAEVRVSLRQQEDDANRMELHVVFNSPTGYSEMTPEEGVTFLALSSELVNRAIQTKMIVQGLSWRREEVEAYQLGEDCSHALLLLECKELIQAGKFVAAIKRYREETRTSLKEGKAAMETLRLVMRKSGEIGKLLQSDEVA